MDYLRAENILYQYELGLLDEPYWAGLRARINERFRDEYIYMFLILDSFGSKRQRLTRSVEIAIGRKNRT